MDKLKTLAPGRLTIVGFVSGTVLVLIFALSHYITSRRSNAAISSAETVDAEHGLLTAKSASDPALYVRAAVPCPEQSVFFNGIDRKTDSAFWSLQCTDGTGYLVEIEPDVEGSITVVNCSTLDAVADVKCFEKIK